MKSTFSNRLFAILFLGTCLLGTVVALASAVRYEPYGVADSQREEFKQKIRDLKERQVALNRDDKNFPRAVVDDPVHRFGMMDPLTLASHTYVICNEGSESLVLTGGETTCKCTLVKGVEQVIEPGDQAEITLTWNSGRVREYYEQTARIRTNDPLNREIDLKIEGKVRSEIATSVGEIVFVNLEPDGQGTSHVDIYSQLFYDFDLSRIESTLDDLVWSVKPLTTDDLAGYEARSGYRVSVKLPLHNVESFINGVLRVRIPRPEPIATVDATGSELDAKQPRPEPEIGDAADRSEILKEISIRGRMPNRLALFGPGLNAERGFDWGTLRTGKRYARELVLITRGSRQPRHLRVGDVQPEFIKATITPKKGYEDRYTLSVVIPDDAPMTIFNVPGKMGRVEIESDLIPSGALVLPMTGKLLIP